MVVTCLLVLFVFWPLLIFIGWLCGDDSESANEQWGLGAWLETVAIVIGFCSVCAVGAVFLAAI